MTKTKNMENKEPNSTNQNLLKDYKFLITSSIALAAFVLSILNYCSDNSETVNSSELRVNLESDELIKVTNSVRDGMNKLGAPLNIEFDIYNNSNKPISIKEIVLYRDVYEFINEIEEKVLKEGVRFDELYKFYKSKTSSPITVDSLYINNRLSMIPINIPANNSINLKLFTKLEDYYKNKSTKINSAKVLQIPKKVYDEIIFNYNFSGDKLYELSDSAKITYEPIFQVMLTTTKGSQLSASSFNNRNSKYDSIYISSSDIPLLTIESIIKNSR